MNRLRVALVGAVLVWVTGCATLDVRHDYNHTIDFSTLATFDWGQSDPPAGDDLMIERVRHAVAEQLRAKGLVQSSEHPDVLVDIRLSRDTGTGGSVGLGASIGIPFGRGLFSIGAGRSRATSTRRTTLVLDFVAPGDQLVWWRGTATDRDDPGATPKQREARMTRAVTELLANFPPRDRPARRLEAP